MDIKKFKAEQEKLTYPERVSQMRGSHKEMIKSHKKTADIISGKKIKKQIENRSGEGSYARVRSLGKHMAKKM